MIMKKVMRLGCLALSFVLSCALLAGCGEKTTDNSSAPDSTPRTTASTKPTEEATTKPTEAPTQSASDPTTTPTETPTTTPTEEPTTAPTTEPSAPADGTAGGKAAALAKELLGKPYKYGSAGPDAFDNSGFLYYCYGQNGVTVPRRTGDLAKQGTEVAKENLLPGDAVFFWSETAGNVEFAGIYVGDGKFIAACNEEAPVKELDMNWAYFAQRYIGARRYAG